MSGGGSETAVGSEATPGGGDKKKDSLGTAGSPAQLIIKDLGEIHSRLLDHRPVIQGETRYFVKEFEEKRGLREMRVLENLKNMIHETNEHTLPKCREIMHDNLNHVLQRLGRERILNQNVQIGSPATENIDYLVIHCKRLLTQSVDSNRGNRNEGRFLMTI
ncbi:biogenesis of lysosome-related organelles complex 1 subunit 5 isoform X2 [Lontra canadensis]|uniref:biogenesis of lysosome-related organelles complex 1 subunit 5 isoform X2 n=1 Tax=Lontra canadensis TaxID=76717 RepID=UPI0013F2EFE2|nr:biogenesis of lysosome-related organelles complex 1 subunit 5 isoform X2 [Lontra canadensis]